MSDLASVSVLAVLCLLQLVVGGGVQATHYNLRVA